MAYLKKSGVNTSLQWGLELYPIIKHSSTSAAKFESIYTKWGDIKTIYSFILFEVRL